MSVDPLSKVAMLRAHSQRSLRGSNSADELNNVDNNNNNNNNNTDTDTDTDINNNNNDDKKNNVDNLDISCPKPYDATNKNDSNNISITTKLKTLSLSSSNSSLSSKSNTEEEIINNINFSVSSFHTREMSYSPVSSDWDLPTNTNLPKNDSYFSTDSKPSNLNNSTTTSFLLNQNQSLFPRNARSSSSSINSLTSSHTSLCNRCNSTSNSNSNSNTYNRSHHTHSRCPSHSTDHYDPNLRLSEDAKETTNARLSIDSQGSPRINQYLLGQPIGRGSYGMVYAGFDTESGLKVAIKSFNKTRLRKLKYSQMTHGLSSRRNSNSRLISPLLSNSNTTELEQINSNISSQDGNYDINNENSLSIPLTSSPSQASSPQTISSINLSPAYSPALRTKFGSGRTFRGRNFLPPSEPSSQDNASPTSSVATSNLLNTATSSQKQHSTNLIVNAAEDVNKNLSHLWKSLASSKQDDPMELVRGEIAILKKLNNPNIIKLYEVLDDPEHDSLYMVFEYCARGSVMPVSPLSYYTRPTNDDNGLSIISKPQALPVGRAWRYFRSLFLAIEYLHSHGIAHRDIKPDNMLVTSDGIVKIVDFGVSETFTTRPESSPGTSGTNNSLGRSQSSDWITKTAGSPAFFAPEICQAHHGGYSAKPTDIWAMGATLYCMIFGRLPFAGKSILDLYNVIMEEEFYFPTDKQLEEINSDPLLQEPYGNDPWDDITVSQNDDKSNKNQSSVDDISSKSENKCQDNCDCDCHSNKNSIDNTKSLQDKESTVNSEKEESDYRIEHHFHYCSIGCDDFRAPPEVRIDSDLKDLLKNMMNKNPEERWTLDQIRESKWMRSSKEGYELLKQSDHVINKSISITEDDIRNAVIPTKMKFSTVATVLTAISKWKSKLSGGISPSVSNINLDKIIITESPSAISPAPVNNNRNTLPLEPSPASLKLKIKNELNNVSLLHNKNNKDKDKDKDKDKEINNK